MPSSSITPEDSDDVFSAVFLVLTDSNKHNKTKQHFSLTPVLSENSPLNFQRRPHHARLLVYLASFPAPAFLQGRKYCLGRRAARKIKPCPKPPFQISVESNKCQEIPSPLFRPWGKSYFCSGTSSSLTLIDCSIQFIFTALGPLWFAKKSRVNNHFHFYHFSAVVIKDIGE